MYRFYGGSTKNYLKYGKGFFMSQKIYVGNMNYATTEAALTTLFGQYGEVVSSSIIKDRYTQQSKGFGFVEMTDPQAAEAAIATLNNQEFEGRRLRVNVAENKPRETRPRSGGGYNDRGDRNGGGYSNDRY